jgi:two-component system response regulator CpxR
LDGFEVLRRLRAGSDEASRVPVVMLTAHGDEVDRIVGLELGADDYVSKPFNPRELLARIQAILRRVSLEKLDQVTLGKSNGAVEVQLNSNTSGSLPPHLRVNDVDIDVKARTVHCAGQELELTAMEFDLLAALLHAAGQVVTREELATDVLKRKLLAFDRSLDMHISKLRRKLGPAPGGAERIKTVRAVGYIYTVTN